MLSSAIASSSPVVMPGAHRGAQQLEGLPDDQAGAAHPVDLLGGLDLDAAVAEGPSAGRSALGDDVERVEDALR